MEGTDYEEEDSGPYGCLRLENCYVRMDPRDEAGNLIRLPGLIADGEYNFVMEGPFDNSDADPRSTVFHDLV